MLTTMIGENIVMGGRKPWPMRNKRRTIFRPIIIAGFSLTLLAVAHDARAEGGPLPAVSVDMPHGGCTLTVRKDGKAALHYGAMPRWVRVTPGTFDFDELVRSLHAASFPQSDRPSRSESLGTVSLPGSEELRLIDDRVLVRSLLERAWEARTAPTLPAGEEDYRWVAKACGF